MCRAPHAVLLLARNFDESRTNQAGNNFASNSRRVLNEKGSFEAKRFSDPNRGREIKDSGRVKLSVRQYQKSLLKT
jgi:hypothetical protein